MYFGRSSNPFSVILIGILYLSPVDFVYSYLTQIISQKGIRTTAEVTIRQYYQLRSVLKFQLQNPVFISPVPAPPRVRTRFFLD